MRKSILIFLFSLTFGAFAQPNVTVDSIPVTLSDAEAQFLKNNYGLLAQRYNVDAAKALVRQAGLINNPNIYYEQSVYNRYSGKYFPTELGTLGNPATQGEFIIQYNYLFSVAGKRNKAVKVAKAQADVAQYQFDDLIRTLLFALRSDFYEIAYGLQSLKLFDEEIASLKDVVSSFETQYQKGNVSLRDITRIRALVFSLQNDRLALFSSLQERSTELAGLLNNGKAAWYKPVVNEDSLAARYSSANLNLSDMVTLALANRADLKEAQAQVASAEAYVKLQKATGVPDLTLQGVFDRNGSYIPNYNGAAISVPLAVFNRNQGNIASAKAQLDAANQLLLQKQVNVQNDVFTAYQRIKETEKLNGSLTTSFSGDFNALLKGAQLNFEKKNLSLLEFIDLFESYKATMLQYNMIKSQRIAAFEELNFNVGKDVFKK